MHNKSGKGIIREIEDSHHTHLKKLEDGKHRQGPLKTHRHSEM